MPCIYCGKTMKESTINDIFEERFIIAQKKKLEPIECCATNELIYAKEGALILSCKHLAKMKCLTKANLEPNKINIFCLKCKAESTIRIFFNIEFL